ncbi:PREDICTED: uncharacterized protein LOC104765089 [Camelina sativa]|uniref:Uncharacterized protein LOC104765089 n=1 Tax=Camelina sativa TaxID=90675 RepID=A0ABM0XJW7_CAMSA|nr:PREDICTED: uncharacterized protein LOC104765089 [Camelina sativa]
MDQIKPEFLKRLTKFIVVSIWVLSLLVTHNFYLYRFTIQLVTHAVDKNYMFLLCNGLLVVVAKCSGLVVSSNSIETSNAEQTFDYRDFKSYGTILELEYDCADGIGRTESFLAEEFTTLEEDTKHQETEEEDDNTLADNDGDEECDLREEEELEDVELLTSTEEEEMNKKFDEFIRKMKEELRIEARRHLILV